MREELPYLLKDIYSAKTAYGHLELVIDVTLCAPAAHAETQTEIIVHIKEVPCGMGIVSRSSIEAFSRL